MNYYVDQSGLEIEEKNIFTTVEITTLLPMRGKMALTDFMLINNWVKAYIPANNHSFDTVPEIQKGLGGKFIESLFNNRLGNWLDNRLMKITHRRWQKKEQLNLKNDRGFEMGMLVNKHFSKPNPAFFQDKVVQLYLEKLDSLPTLCEEMLKPI